ncbi:hypothetical protein QP411_00655 [Pseudoglutamicibacter cumminsii]|uniref:Gram-positive cocci surface proteins LPxTG domain-containing protein n=1 Tax=Pseudoglutamicibacter cumminsii TaxID=156979 RepID=A0AAP4C7B3_9MICC|nr:hypothetical protein [Pseudoglutamicibacter cumminsii]MDK6274418.1 hypothetical protein [Pseudoglutamicibacter cumminsii]MDK7082440.1 hypothetical protein [Pseudoglutamicibacter cumminsii]
MTTTDFGEQMTMKRHAVSWGRTAAVLLAVCAVLCALGFAGFSPAHAAKIVGQGSSDSGKNTSGSDIVTIIISPGNPEDDHSPAAGKVSGVTVKLERLKGVSAENSSDMKRVESASVDDIAAWPKDRSFSKVTNAGGSVTFAHLPKGIYLASSSAPNESYREINSFLVAAPFHSRPEGDSPVEGVIVAKSRSPQGPPPGNEPPPTPPAVDTPEKPKTPQDHDQSMPATGAQVTTTVIIAALLIGAGFIIIVASRRKLEGGKK